MRVLMRSSVWRIAGVGFVVFNVFFFFKAKAGFGVWSNGLELSGGSSGLLGLVILGGKLKPNSPFVIGV